MKRFIAILVLLAFPANSFAGLLITRGQGISLTGADGIDFVGVNGISLTGADGFLTTSTNGISLTGADGISLTGADSIPTTSANSATYTGPNGISLTGADGISLTGADGISLTGADGISLTGADGVQHHADSVLIRNPNGISLTGADGITLTGVDGISLTGADAIVNTMPNVYSTAHANGISLTGADGISLTGADGISLTGADEILGVGPDGILFTLTNPTGISLTGADGIGMTGGDGISLTGADGILLTGVDGTSIGGVDTGVGLQSIDPELATVLNNMTDDSSINAVVTYNRQIGGRDLNELARLGILGGTRFRVLPMIYITATRSQLIAISRMRAVRSIYGNRTLNFNSSDPYFNITGLPRIAGDSDLHANNSPGPTGNGVTVAVLDTGINRLHSDLAGKVVQNVRLNDLQSVPLGWQYPLPLENQMNTDLVEGHGTFVSGIIAGSGAASGGKYTGIAPGANLLGLSAGDANLTFVLSGLDYLLDKQATYHEKVVNCSFSADTVFDMNDPVNIATKMLTDRGVNIVFSAGNNGAGNSTMNPYAMAPWVVGVGATDQNGVLAGFSSRGAFGDTLQHPSLVAPGVSIASLRSLPTITSVGGVAGADLTRLTVNEIPYYTTASGTSFSAPQVAGAIALMLEENPSLTPAQVKDILSRTATPMPKYFYHEAGAGMLNTYAAVLEAAYPQRAMGGFRSMNATNSVSFVTTRSQPWTQHVTPGSTSTHDISVPANTVEASVDIAWALSTNDFGLRLLSGNTLLGDSNYLNAPGLTARTEKVVLRDPTAQNIHVNVDHTANLGTAQNVTGIFETTRAVYPQLADLTGANLTQAQTVMLMNVMLPLGSRFRPNSVISRSDLAEAMLRAGLVTQYMAKLPRFTDVHDPYRRNFIESSFDDPRGSLFYDVSSNGAFHPDDKATRLIAAYAFVKAANLEGERLSTPLPLNMTDASSIPVEYQGYVAVALAHGFLTLDGTAFNKTRGLTRIELANALNHLLSS